MGKNTIEVSNNANVNLDIIEEVIVLDLGVTGPQGPKGEAGDGTVSYVHIQDTSSDVWTINHGLAFMPNITVVDSAGTVVEGAIEYLNSTTIVARFSGEFSGKAYLS